MEAGQVAADELLTLKLVRKDGIKTPSHSAS
jgi:hypothetical protein